eukprot:Gb_29482 [translate_table: standard]
MDFVKDDEKILSYGDVVLRRSDLKILQGPCFLNDRIIEFYFCYLSSLSSRKMLLVGPCVSFWILNAPDIDSIQECVHPLKLPEQDLVIFPVNNNKDVGRAEGGTHWSLLVYHRKKNVFEHYDSFSGDNMLYARKLFAKIKDFMSPAVAAKLIEHFTPQQSNGYDCGLYALAIAKELCFFDENEAKTSGEDWTSILKSRVTSSTVTEMRNHIIKVINDLSDNK